MSSIGIKITRALVVVMLLALSAWTTITMDLEKIIAQQKPFVQSGAIEWKSGSVPILDHFFPVDIFNQIWRGTMATFSPSTLGYDEIAWWQMFSFLIDLGPLYTILLLESFRPANARTPAYFPTISTVLAQFSGIGIAVPFFLSLCLVVSPGAQDLAKLLPSSRTVGDKGIWNLLPAVLLFHTAQVILMFHAPDLTTRHYWTWAWQASPLWIGIIVTISSIIGKARTAINRPFGNLHISLMVLGAISTAVWLFTLTSAPFSMVTIFLPTVETQTDYVLHSRKALQADEIGAFLASFLWLSFSFYDLHVAGLLGRKWLLYIVALPVTTIFAGPGTALIVGWYLKETALRKNGASKVSK